MTRNINSKQPERAQAHDSSENDEQQDFHASPLLDIVVSLARRRRAAAERVASSEQAALQLGQAAEALAHGSKLNHKVRGRQGFASLSPPPPSLPARRLLQIQIDSEDSWASTDARIASHPHSLARSQREAANKWRARMSQVEAAIRALGIDNETWLCAWQGRCIENGPACEPLHPPILRPHLVARPSGLAPCLPCSTKGLSCSRSFCLAAVTHRQRLQGPCRRCERNREPACWVAGQTDEAHHQSRHRFALEIVAGSRGLISVDVAALALPMWHPESERRNRESCQ